MHPALRFHRIDSNMQLGIEYWKEKLNARKRRETRIYATLSLL